MSVNPYIGQIDILPYTFAPRSYAFCEGQLVSIIQFQALFAIIGTIYGGDARVTMGLPNLKGRVPMGFGHAPGLTPWQVGQRGGEAAVLLFDSDLPPHQHVLTAYTELGPDDAQQPDQSLGWAQNAGGDSNNLYKSDPPSGTVTSKLSDHAISNVASSNQPHENRQPFLAMRFCIAMDGVWPARN